MYVLGDLEEGFAVFEPDAALRGSEFHPHACGRVQRHAGSVL